MGALGVRRPGAQPGNREQAAGPLDAHLLKLRSAARGNLRRQMNASSSPVDRYPKRFPIVFAAE